MKHTVIAFLCILFASVQASAQTDSAKTSKKKERKIELSGEVYDSFTKAKVKAFMTLMRKDSTVVDTMTCWTWGTSSYYEFKVPAKNDDFIIRATADGYARFTVAPTVDASRTAAFLAQRGIRLHTRAEVGFAAGE